MLHFLSLFMAIESHPAREWVCKQHQSYRENRNEKLEERYRRLMEYFDKGNSGAGSSDRRFVSPASRSNTEE